MHPQGWPQFHVNDWSAQSAQLAMAQVRQFPEFQLSFDEWFWQRFGNLQMSEAQKTEIEKLFKKIGILSDLVDLWLNIEMRQERALQNMTYTLTSRNQVSELLSRREPSEDDTFTFDQRKKQYGQSASSEWGEMEYGQPTTSGANFQWESSTTGQNQASNYPYTTVGV